MIVFRFESSQFNVKEEPRNEFNPIFGHAVGEHIRKELEKRGIEVTDEVDNEDWGWYFYGKIDDQQYLIGTCSYIDVDDSTEEPLFTGDPVEHLVQFDKHRTLKEQIFGRNKMTEDDAMVSLVESIVQETISDINYLGRD